MKDTQDNLIRLGTLSRKLNVPAVWLREQTIKGYLPHINAGGIFLFNLEAVKNALADMANRKGGEQ